MQIDVLSGGLWNEVTTDFLPMTVDAARQVARHSLVFLFPEHFSPEGPI